MSYFCKFCGKVLTTGDDIDRCNPDCSQKSMPVFEIEQISWDILKYQNDQLKAENDRLKSDAEQNELILLALHEALKEKQEHVQDLEQELKNKCANCGLASHDIWGDEDNVYDNLTTEEE